LSKGKEFSDGLRAAVSVWTTHCLLQVLGTLSVSWFKELQIRGTAEYETLFIDTIQGFDTRSPTKQHNVISGTKLLFLSRREQRALLLYRAAAECGLWKKALFIVRMSRTKQVVCVKCKGKVPRWGPSALQPMAYCTLDP
jgi:hypothetical protein